MKRIRLDLDALRVTSCETAPLAKGMAAPTYPPYCPCCTGCDSGCGIAGSEVGCESAGPTNPPEC